jgi:pimeloyl-ACP methyl ester carboxylesterase
MPREEAYLASSEARLVSTGSGRIATWHWGPANAPLIGLLHGWEGHAAQLGGFAAPLVSAGFRVLAFDSPGHGESAGSEAHVPLIARTLIELAKEFGDFFGLVGHSMGAAAAAMATTLGITPAGVVFLAPPLCQVDRVTRLSERLQLTPGVRAAFIAALERKTGFRHEDVDMRVAARASSFPALLVHDPADRSCPFRNSELIAAEWPGARIVPCPGRGHLRILSTAEVHQQAVGFFEALRSR